MTASTSTLFCIVCGREFRPRDADTVICPDCGGPPEAPAPSQPQETVLADQPRGTVLMSQPAYQRMCILCGQDFTTPDPQADRCPQCRGEAPHPQPEIRSRPESRQPTPAMPAAAQGTVAVSESGMSPAPSSADVPLTWNAGDVILDLYEVKGELGKGGMGVVYRVHHRRWNIDLAVKTPLPQALQKAGSLENFLREAQAWVDLGLHPHIVTCYYVRRLGEMPRVFAECMEGGSLKNWMEDGRLYAGGEREALQRILDCAIQFAWGLGYAHEKGLVHQDVKPANALMTPDGMLKVTDFGLVGAKGYTPAYAAPEQELGQAVSPRTDIWGWGVSVLEMFTGGVHWQFGSIAASVLENYLQEAPPEGIPPMPAALAELLRQCFQNDPDQRPASMDEVAERLMRLYEQETGAPYPRPKPQALDMRADSLNNKAVSLLDLGLEEEAVRCWQEALRLDPKHLDSTYNMGLLRWRKGEISDIQYVKELKGAISNKTLAQAHYLIGLIHIERADLASALEHLKKATELSPSNYDFLSTMGLIYFGLGVYDEASLLFSKAKDLAPFESRYQIYLVISLLREGRILEARTHLLQIVSSSEGRKALFSLLKSSFLEDIDATLSMLYQFSVPCVQIAKSFAGHSDSVLCLSFSPDNQFLLSGSRDSTIKLWQVKTGRAIMTYKGHTKGVTSVAFSPDMKMVLSGSQDGTAKLWNTETGQDIVTLEHDDESITSVCFSRDGRFVVTASWAGTIKIWNWKENDCVHTINDISFSEGPALYLSSVDILGNDAQTVISGHKEVTKVWNILSGECLITLEGFIFEDGEKVYTASDKVSCWGRILFLAFRNEGASFEDLVMLDLDKAHKRITFEEGKHLETDRKWINSICLSSDGSYCAVARENSLFHLWDVSTIARKDKTIIEPLAYRVSKPLAADEYINTESQVRDLIEKAKSFIRNGEKSLSYEILCKVREFPGYDKRFDIQRIISDLGNQHGKRVAIKDIWLLQRITLERTTGWLSAKPPLIKFLTATSLLLEFSEGNLGIWNIRENSYSKTLTFPSKGFAPVWISSDMRCFLLKHGVEDTFTWWCPGKETFDSFTVSPEIYHGIYVSDDGKHLFTGHVNFLAHRCATSGEEIAKYEFEETLQSFSISRDLKFCALATYTWIKILDLASKEQISAAVSKNPNSLQLQFSPSGKLLLQTGHRIDLFEMKDQKYYFSPRIKLYPEEKNRCYTATFLPDGNLVAISHESGFENALQLWMWNHVQEVYTLIKEVNRQGFVESISVSPDGRFVGLVTGGVNGKYCLELWELDWEWDFPAPADWDEGARPYLDIFLTLHTPYAPDGLRRVGKPQWTEEDFQKLLQELGYRGYGWLRPEGVRRELEKMAKERK
jgi:WD40 repeat protein/serine/threonine protein kinase